MAVDRPDLEICKCKHSRAEHLVHTRHCQRGDCYCSEFRQSPAWEQAQDRAYEIWNGYKRNTGRDPVVDGMALLIRANTWIELQDNMAPSNGSSGTLFGTGEREQTLFGLPIIVTTDPRVAAGEVRAVMPHTSFPVSMPNAPV